MGFIPNISAIYPLDMPSYWISQTSAGEFPCVTGKIKCNVAIIGGGLTGLSIAFHLKSHFKHWSIVVLEGSKIGHGASGKSGGVIVNHPNLIGSESDASYLKKFLCLHRLRCEWQTNPDVCHQHLLNPYLLTNEIASLCHSVGVQIFERSKVRQIDLEGRYLIGDNFYISSDLLFVATDAAISLLESFVDEFSLTVQNCIAIEVTKPVSQILPWAYFSEVEGNKYVWGRKIHQNIFLYGNEERVFDKSVSSPSNATQDILTSLKNELPSLEYCKVIGTWSGLISRFLSGGRRIIQLDQTGKCFYIGGYDGYGIAAAVRSGFVIKSLIQGYQTPWDFPLTLCLNNE